MICSTVQNVFLDAVRALDGREICGQRVRVEMRKKERRTGGENDRRYEILEILPETHTSLHYIYA